MWYFCAFTFKVLMLLVFLIVFYLEIGDGKERERLFSIWK